MRYFSCTLLGAALMSFALVALGYTIYQLLQIGTCAEGNTPYDIERVCPAGTFRLGLFLPGSIMLLLLGAGIYAFRGRAPGSDKGPNQGLLLVWVWTGLFWSIAAASFLGVWGPHANPGQGGKLGGLIVAFLFVPMGAGGLFGFRGGNLFGFEQPKSLDWLTGSGDASGSGGRSGIVDP